SRHEDDVIVSYQLEITLAGLLPEELESLTAALAQVECLPVPRVMDATCFHLAEMQPDFGFSIVLFNQAFFFPRDATAAEVENEINNWLAVEQPEGYTGVEVDIERKLGGSLTISLDLKEAGE
ncbi:hypothetical protein JW859_08035, partial [bacterium]|nr:hypothetical protein [bacterium]